MATLQRTTFLLGAYPVPPVFSRAPLTWLSSCPGNLHCPSCVHSIESLLTTSPISLDASARIEISLLTSLLTFSHPPALLPAIESILVEGGFEIIHDRSPHPGTSTSIPLVTKWWESQSAREKKEREKIEEEKRMGEAHLLACRACREGTAEVTVKGKGVECVVKMEREGEKVTTLVIGGMTCSSCLGSIKSILSSEADGRIREARVTLLPGRAVVRHSSTMKADELKEMIEDGGFDAEVVESVVVAELETGWVETRLLLEGLTCS
jgi:Cu+-exporting ATPase